MQLTKEMIEPAVYGGLFYGGGGGGILADGLRYGNYAFECGTPHLIDIDEVDEAATVLTASMVGAPADMNNGLEPQDFIRSVELFQKNYPLDIGGIISNENGAVATINGWIQSAYFQMPVIDAPANGRAQPTGVMGSMGLNLHQDYLSRQSLSGGGKSAGKHIEAFMCGSIDNTSAAIRQMAAICGGMLAVLRNPVTAAFVKENGAPGAIKQAIKVGEANIAAWSEPSLRAAEAVAAAAGGQVIDTGLIVAKDLKTEAGFDFGKIEISNQGKKYCSVLWNEYLNLDYEGQRLAAFPDLVVFFDLEQLRSLTSAEIEVGQHIAIILVPQSKLKLGRGMFVAENFNKVHTLIGQP